MRFNRNITGDCLEQMRVLPDASFAGLVRLPVHTFPSGTSALGGVLNLFISQIFFCYNLCKASGNFR